MNSVTPKYSLVLCTLGRFDEVLDFLRSLAAQDYCNYELIVVDQNTTERLRSHIFDIISKDRIKYFNVNFTGLSRARNFGLQFVEGDIVAFPDDDCTYESNVLSKLASLFHSPKSCVLVGEENHFYGMPWSSSYRIFLTAEFLGEIRFDEDIGVGSGSQFGAGEELMFTRRIYLSDYNFYFNSDLKIYHPKPDSIFDNYNKMRLYSIGNGAVYYTVLGFLCGGGALIKELILNIISFNKNGTVSVLFKIQGLLRYATHIFVLGK